MQLKKICFYLFFGCMAVFGTTGFAQNISNEGTDFWTVFPTHDASGTLAIMNVNITAKKDTRVTVSCGSYSESRDVKANTIEIFEVDRSQSYIDYSYGNKLLTNRAIHIVVAPNLPKVVAYSHVYASNRSAATLILPRESLGQKYFSMNYIQSGGGSTGQNYLALIAVEDETDLILHKKDGTTLPINLPKAGDVYEFISTSKEDLTGTFVEIDQSKSLCKRFAAFSGATTITIGPCSGSSDPLLQQLYSINSWGKNYGIVPFKNRNYIIRVLAQEENTVIKLNGSTIITKNKGEFYDFPISTEAAIVSADKLISVAQYSLTQNCSSITGTALSGDPEMVLLNPIEFNINNITVFASNRNLILEKYINVFMKTNKVGTFLLNGSTSGIYWTPMPSDPTYSFAQILVAEETLTLTADDGFNAIAYGFGQTESYAYSAGTNLYSTSTLSLFNISSGLNNSSAACLGQATIPKLTVPYLLKSITWDFNDGNPPVIESVLGNPIVNFDNVGNPTYTYAYSGSITFGSLGPKPIKAIAVLSQVDLPLCVDGNDLEFNFEIEVVPLGDASFILPDICAGTPITLKDDSKILGSTISKWEWKIDGVQFDDKDPIHIFTLGTHVIKLRVANASGCWSDVAEQTITVNKLFPKLELKSQEPVCIKDSPIQLIVYERMGLIPLKASFTGNGVSSTGIFNPSDAGVGIHTITYSFTSNAAGGGCTDVITQDIEVYATTLIDAPSTVYILAGGQRVIPVSIKTPNPAYNYKYKWTPSSGLSKDDVLSPIAFPESDTRYTLTISIDGLCDVSQEVLVKVLNQVKPPNSFSPNGDGTNDVWNIPSLDSYPNSETSIFNRSGQKVFFSKGYINPFDGNYRNNPLPVGVYYYIIDPKNGRGKITGSLTIIR